MSNFRTQTKHPKTGKWENADWLDDEFGSHQYGIRFKDGSVFRENEIKEFKYGVACNPIEEKKKGILQRIYNFIRRK